MYPRPTPHDRWFIGIEHGVLLLRAMVDVMYSNEPGWLAEAKEVLQFRIKHLRTKVTAATPRTRDNYSPVRPSQSRSPQA